MVTVNCHNFSECQVQFMKMVISQLWYRNIECMKSVFISSALKMRMFKSQHLTFKNIFPLKGG